MNLKKRVLKKGGQTVTISKNFLLLFELDRNYWNYITLINKNFYTLCILVLKSFN